MLHVFINFIFTTTCLITPTKVAKYTTTCLSSFKLFTHQVIVSTGSFQTIKSPSYRFYWFISNFLLTKLSFLLVHFKLFTHQVIVSTGSFQTIYSPSYRFYWFIPLLYWKECHNIHDISSKLKHFLSYFAMNKLLPKC